MKGKLSHSMSDMERSVGGTPPPPGLTFPYEDIPCLQWHPSLSPFTIRSLWSDWLGHSGLSLFKSACPQRGCFWLLGRLYASLLWRLAVVQLGGEVCLNWKWSIRKPINTVCLNIPSIQLLSIIKPFFHSPSVSQLVLNSGGQWRSSIYPLP